MTMAIAVCTVVVVLAAYLCARWLDILALGARVADALGVGIRHARLIRLVIAVILTAD
jgi:ABC-type Fe3+-siderophore transport system permease subunit